MQNFIKYKNNEVFAFHTFQDNQLLTTSIVSKIQEIVFQFVLRHNCGNIVIYIVLIHIMVILPFKKKVFQLTKSI